MKTALKKTLARVTGGAFVLALACGGTQSTGPGGGDGSAGGGDGMGGGSSGGAPLAEQFRQSQPKPTAPRPFQLPAIQTFKLGKEINVYLVESHNLPIVSASLVLPGGSMNDPRGKEGLASVCMDMLTEGTKKLDKIAFQRALADIGSSVWSWASNETQGLSMRTLSKNFDATLALFADSLRKPAFRKPDLQRSVKRRIASIKQAKGNPAAVAGRLLWSVSFGPKHPEGRVTTEKSLGKLRTFDCKRYHRAQIKPGGANLFVVGDLNEAQVRKAFEPLLKTWRGKAKVGKMPKRKPRKGRIFFVDIPGAAQSSIYFSHAGPQRKDPGYFANWMMAQIFGGSFASRVNMNLREDKGYSYGARGGFSYTRDFGSFYAGSSVRSDSTVQSIRELAKEMRNLHGGQTPPTAAELDRVKSGAIAGLPARFATSRQALGQYRSLVYYELPLDYYNTFVSKVDAVNLQEVTNAAKEQLRPDKVQLLVVGDGSAAMKVRKGGKDVPMVDEHGQPVTLRQALEQMAAVGELGDGGLVVLDAAGNVVKQRPRKGKGRKLGKGPGKRAAKGPRPGKGSKKGPKPGKGPKKGPKPGKGPKRGPKL